MFSNVEPKGSHFVVLEGTRAAPFCQIDVTKDYFLSQQILLLINSIYGFVENSVASSAHERKH